MKKLSILDQIAAIRGDATLNIRQKHAAIICIDQTGKKGAAECRAIQQSIRDKQARVVSKVRVLTVTPRNRYEWANTRPCRLGEPMSNQEYLNSDQRKAARYALELAAQREHELLMLDAERGYPTLVLGRDTTAVAINKLPGGCSWKHSRLGDWIISSQEDVSWDNHAYSKTWHRAHGGKKTVDSRTVQIRKWTPSGTIKMDVELSSWAGNWAIKALVQSGLVQPVKLPKALKAVQLNTAFDVRLVRTILGVSVYERTLAGCHYDYCALGGDVAYQADTIRDAIKGLHEKTTAKSVAKNSPITWALCKSLGFCDTGIREFCSDFGLSEKGSYSAAQIHDLVKSDLAKSAKYQQELRKVAAALDYAI